MQGLTKERNAIYKIFAFVSIYLSSSFSLISLIFIIMCNVHPASHRTDFILFPQPLTHRYDTIEGNCTLTTCSASNNNRNVCRWIKVKKNKQIENARTEEQFEFACGYNAN